MDPTGIYIQASEKPEGLILAALPPENCSLVIFGASGDLTARKIFPALYHLSSQKLLPDCFEIIAFARSIGEAEPFKEVLLDQLRKRQDLAFDDAAWRRLVDHLAIIQGDYDSPDSYAALGDQLQKVEQACQTAGNRFFYLATPADSFPVILRKLHEANLIYRNPAGTASPWSRVVIEKPFGRDLASARELNKLAATVLDESQTYRIDHFLGKETVQNILVMRFGNSIFEPLWNRKYISHIEITVAESLGIEKRSRYYEKAGALRDMVQNHLMQLLALCAMEQPAKFGPNEIRDEKAKVLRTLKPPEGKAVQNQLIFGQYEGYTQEPGVEANSRTPTFAALKVEIANWRWQGVPFYLRTGKHLGGKVSEIVVHFMPIPLCLFGSKDVCENVMPNVLVLRIQPDEGISLQIASKIPGEDLSVGTVSLDFSYQEAFKKREADAYERLLLDVMRGNATLFARRDEVELAWEFVDPLLESYDRGAGPPLHPYTKGSQGPFAAQELLAREGHQWKKLSA